MVLMVAEKPSIAQCVANALCTNTDDVAIRGSAPCVTHLWRGAFEQCAAVDFRMTSVLGHIYRTDFAAETQDAARPRRPLRCACQKIRRQGDRRAASAARHAVPMRSCCGSTAIARARTFASKSLTTSCRTCAPPTHSAFARRFIARASHRWHRPICVRRFARLACPTKTRRAPSTRAKRSTSRSASPSRASRPRTFSTNSPISTRASSPTVRVRRPRSASASRATTSFARSSPSRSGSSTSPSSTPPTALRSRGTAAALFARHGARLSRSRARRAHRHALSCTTTPTRRVRPIPLNTVDMLKIASRQLGISPKQAMQLAEHLYTAGFISYPRTESSRYADAFRLARVLQAHEARDLGRLCAFAADRRASIDRGATASTPATTRQSRRCAPPTQTSCAAPSGASTTISRATLSPP
jgi:hypothetical protein